MLTLVLNLRGLPLELERLVALRARAAVSILLLLGASLLQTLARCLRATASPFAATPAAAISHADADTLPAAAATLAAAAAALSAAAATVPAVSHQDARLKQTAWQRGRSPNATPALMPCLSPTA